MEEEDPVTEEAVDEAQDRLDRLGIHEQVKAGDVFPGQWAPVLSRSVAGAVRFFPMRWGYTGKKLLINARSETADKLPTFADSFLNRRCLIPFSWYYEWGETEEGKVPFAIRPEGEGRFFLAGLSMMAMAMYFKKSYMASLLAGISYSFSGFMLYAGIRHFQFITPLILLPLMIIAMEQLIRYGKWYMMTVLVALSLLCSYYFLYMNTIALGFYFVCRILCTKDYRSAKFFFARLPILSISFVT